MRRLFRQFEAEGVEYLVIGDVASAHYGASQLTEAFDLWLRPTASNLRAFVRALAHVRARVCKLTPPLTLALARRGHGFHFVVPEAEGPGVYLDVMGRPPRVGSFGQAKRRAMRAKTHFGVLSFAAIEDLVELKKTGRPWDYEVITRLAQIRLQQAKVVGGRLAAWVVENIFRVDDLVRVVGLLGPRVPEEAWRKNAALAVLRSSFERGREPSLAELDRVEAAIDERVRERVLAGRLYWKPILRDLRTLRLEGRLLPDGLPVRRLLEA
jgi:hypothetical protein